ncbi:hypothetical protein FGB62_26g014 [Gracilaria domingensis]|nr:hypothetical protein FGB62_26g014 [Gracilaria domingensis]
MAALLPPRRAAAKASCVRASKRWWSRACSRGANACRPHLARARGARHGAWPWWRAQRRRRRLAPGSEESAAAVALLPYLLAHGKAGGAGVVRAPDATLALARAARSGAASASKRRGGRGAVGDREAADDVGVAEAGGAVKQHEHPDLYVPRALSEQQRWPACPPCRPPSTRDPLPLFRAALRRLIHPRSPSCPTPRLPRHHARAACSAVCARLYAGTARRTDSAPRTAAATSRPRGAPPGANAIAAARRQPFVRKTSGCQQLSAQAGRAHTDLFLCSAVPASLVRAAN